MSDAAVWSILDEMGAVLKDDHFVYTKGGHGSEYVNKDALFTNPKKLSYLTCKIADAFRGFGESETDVVLGPAVAGALVAQSVAYHLSNSVRPVHAVYADKEGEGFVLKRGYDAFIPGKRILVVEDVLNTGGSVKQIVELARAHGGEIIGVDALCNRGGVKKWDIGNVPYLYSVVSVDMKVYDADKCPLCAQEIPINTKIGKGKEFVLKHGQPGKVL